MNKLSFITVLTVVLWSCGQTVQKDSLALDKASFTTNVDGKNTQLFELTNKNGIKVALSSYGGRIVSICVPDKDGNMADVIQGFASVESYKTNEYNALIGPFANRIAKAQFSIGDETYKLTPNDNGNCLHNGNIGFKHTVLDAMQSGNSVVMTVENKDGEFGFPGNKKVKVTYTLTDYNELKIDYKATTDKACPFNLTNHAYFNLRGESNGDILGHIMYIDADSTTAIDKELIPTGEIVSIKGTDMDFTTPTLVGKRINSNMEAMKIGNGYDHNYILNKDQNTDKLTLAARVEEPESKRVMEVYTTEPAIQFYSGNFQDGSVTGKGGKQYNFRSGFCLETQHYPDSPNHDNFPNTILEPGQTLKSTTIYKFSVKK